MNSPALCSLIASALIVTLCSVGAVADDGVGTDKILFGQVAALSGPAQALGQGMREGLLAAFDEVNRAGGIGGRKLALKSVDDGYEPEKTIEATKKIITEDKVFALVGSVGTPTSKAGQPIASAAKIPFIGPFTGAEFLRDPYNRYVVNIRSSYFQETEAWIEHLTKDLGITKIAILYQDDAFGLAGLEGVNRAMTKRNMALVASGSFRRNTEAVKSALLDIMKAEPEAVVTVGPYKPVCQVYQTGAPGEFEHAVCGDFLRRLGRLGERTGRRGCRRHSQPGRAVSARPVVAGGGVLSGGALRTGPQGAKPNFVSLEGYLVGRLVVETLKRLPGEPTREGFLDADRQGTVRLWWA